MKKHPKINKLKDSCSSLAELDPAAPLRLPMQAPPWCPCNPPHARPMPTSLSPPLVLPNHGRAHPSAMVATGRCSVVAPTYICRAQEGCEGNTAAQDISPQPTHRLANFRAGMRFPISGILLIIIAVINTKGILAVFLSAQPLCL